MPISISLNFLCKGKQPTQISTRVAKKSNGLECAVLFDQSVCNCGDKHIVRSATTRKSHLHLGCTTNNIYATLSGLKNQTGASHEKGEDKFQKPTPTTICLNKPFSGSTWMYNNGHLQAYLNHVLI